MKKNLIYILYFIVFFSFFRVYASPITYSRTKDDLRLPKDVEEDRIDVDTVLKIPAVDASAKIYDFANLLTDAEETKLFMQLNEFKNNTGLDAIIITVNNLDGLSLKDYTYGFYDYNDFDSSGVSFTIYVDSDKKSVFMGNNGTMDSEVYKAYPDKRVSDILKYVYTKHIDKDDYYGACEAYIKLIDGLYIKTFGSYHGKEQVENKSISWIEIAIISFVLSLIVVLLLYSKFQKKERWFDLSIKKSVNYHTMVVKCEYDKDISVNKNGNS